MASLIHKNRFAGAKRPASEPGSSSPVKRESSPAAEGSSAKKPRRRLHLDASFRPIRSDDIKEEGDGDDDPESADEGEDEKSDDNSRPGADDGPHATLVVCPVSLMHQWKSELERSAKKRSLSVQGAPVICLPTSSATAA